MQIVANFAGVKLKERMNRQVAFFVKDDEILEELFGAAAAVSPMGRNNVAYSVNVCRFMKELTGEDFTNEMPRGDTFTSVSMEGNRVTFVTSAESVHLPTIHKLIDYMMDWYEDYDVRAEFEGRLFRTTAATYADLGEE